MDAIDKLLESLDSYKKKELVYKNVIKLLLFKIQDLEDINKSFGKIHNERGAGRKSTVTKEELEKITQLHQEGKSYGSIAKEVSLSKTYVYKLINKY